MRRSPAERVSLGPSAQQFSGKAIQRQILAEALQHPTTLYPFAACALAATYGVFVAPFVGGQPWALLAAGGTGVAAAASFAWHYLVQGEAYARAKARAVIDAEQRRRQQAEDGALRSARSDLERDLKQMGAAEALEVQHDLAGEYDRLVAVLDRQDDADSLAVARVKASAAAAYRRGLDLLQEASELINAVSFTDQSSLRAEVAELETEIAQLAQAGASGDRIALKQQNLEANRETLELLEKQALKTEWLLQSARLVEADLRRVRVALPTLDWGVGGACNELIEILDEPAREAAPAASADRPREATAERYQERRVR